MLPKGFSCDSLEISCVTDIVKISNTAATVFRTIKDVLPEGYRCSSETGNLIMECCMEFMRMISDETSQLCAKEGKSTIGADHVLKSLESLGFHAWRKDLDAALSSHKEVLITTRLFYTQNLKDLQEETQDEQEPNVEQWAEVRKSMQVMSKP
ncbi:hypothetical protein GUITHDRAFT_73993 [Guillardia theta CCMP2712]|uniref:Transcription factor CBF/NF-Y/archaeal histone domain-containing protein n=1 Tax=Guillardia theta (strain CCMP2712) TaxID=905079 RepID=L1J2E4_GUITC|nr:hypothetical protein GUITHDRAFT_73993 [Guillardia theta CCMP2712]EKX42279.1 hypothetical protein GUITHDRAFT_73993 [Guillardia theta CCMP2712]|eukprot:XP_005829259.1 hypothetical protein GUITHDRAFT_73993 [Guillardia theta CCMP2712]